MKFIYNMIIEINDKKYTVSVANSEEEKEKGLMHVKNLPENEGMLFIYDEPQTIGMWMKNCLIPLDIIFINEDQEVISIYHGKPNNKTIVEEDNVLYVLELNSNSGVNIGDEIEFEDEDDSLEDTMKVLGPNAEIQMELVGGERIFSRPNTKILLRLAKKAYKTKEEKDYILLGKKIFKFLDTQDSNKPEFVSI